VQCNALNTYRRSDCFKCGSHRTAASVSVPVAAANARANWVSAAMNFTEGSSALSAAQVNELAQLRAAFEELTEVYEATRRMVERGYLVYR
jgi:hypothetical protein